MSENEALMKRGDVIRPQSDRERYKIVKFLGQGGFGKVFAADCVLSGRRVAVKVISKKQLKEKSQARKIAREIELHRLSRHANIVRMTSAFEDRNAFFMIMELCQSTTLYHRINETHASIGYFDEYQASRYVGQLIDAVIYLAEIEIIHRDLKPGNVLISHGDNIKLCDFGLASRIEDLLPGSVSGTPNYLAPEVIQKAGHSLASEVWSIGCLVFCMLVGKPPFEASTVQATYDRILTGIYTYPPNLCISDAAKSMIRGCLTPNYHQRSGLYFLSTEGWIEMTQASVNPYVKALIGTNGQPEPMPPQRASFKLVNNNHIYGVPMPTFLPPTSPTCDSGLGYSDHNMMCQSSSAPALVRQLALYTRNVIELAARRTHLVPSSFPSLAVAKWVDYSNRHGFGCKLTNGTLAIKFNNGTCLSWPPNSDTLLYTTDPFSTPRALNTTGRMTALEEEQVQLAVSYRNYMDMELNSLSLPTSTYPPNPSEDAIRVVYQRIQKGHVVIYLSDGTLQVLLMKCRTKIIMWKGEDDSYIGISVVPKHEAPTAYRCIPFSNSLQLNEQPKLRKIFNDMIPLMESDLRDFCSSNLLPLPLMY